MSQVETNGLHLEVDISAPQQQSSPIPVLMIMGLGMQLTAWPAELVDGLLAQGRVVIRFDNRDIGLSTKRAEWGRPNLWVASVKHAMGLPEPALRKRIAVGVHRSVHPLGVARQMVAIVACGDRSALLTRITAPTTIIHGRSDPLIPVAAAEDLGRKIPGSQVTIIDGMGHDLPPAVIPALLDAMRDTFARGER
jgi:pimeloyl-ACP methyl ester carboxylesterase